MLLNPSKCAVISFCRKKESVLFDYKLSGTIIPREAFVKDLGVILDAKLTYRQHTAYIVDKASRNLGLVFRMTKDFTDVYRVRHKKMRKFLVFLLCYFFLNFMQKYQQF